MNTVRQAGFSAVELLITLFIAAAFIGSGYQLYSVVIDNGSEARLRTRASNVAYENLRTYAPQATNPCTTVTPTPAPTVPASAGLPNPSITVTITCPHGATQATSKVNVTVRYGSPQQEVTHALYVAN